MRYYFEDAEKTAKLEKILQEWLGTPYRHHCGVKGLGADCIHFVARVFEEMGILTWRKDLMPDYPRDWHLHSPRQRLAESIEKEFRVVRIGLDELMAGDIVLHHFGQAASHAAIFSQGSVFHAIDRRGVLRTPVTDTKFRRHAQFAYRILK
jgi:cell wall-associated NlpC family hydrolase